MLGGWLEDDSFPEGSVVTMGVFDGFHRGHQALLGRAVARGRDLGLPVVLVTFSPHPLAVVAPDRAPRQLMPVEDRVAWALEHGADDAVVLAFTRQLATMPAADFMRSFLYERLQCRSLVVGSNFRCGHRGQGDVAFLRAEGTAYGMEVEGLDLVEHASQTCSSTAIRQALARGDAGTARDLLGRDDRLLLTH